MTATVVYAHSIMDPTLRDITPAPVGQTVASLAPAGDLPVVCMINGEYRLRKDWGRTVREGDVITFLSLPRGGGGSSPIMVLAGIAMMAASFIPGMGIFATPLLMAGASMALSGFLAPAVASTSSSSSSTYTVQLSGNTSRLRQPLPVFYGRMFIVPDFAAQPWNEFNNETNDQYYYALLCIGAVPEFTLESIQLADTAISHFSDVEYQLVGPNFDSELTLIDPCVVTSQSVSQQELDYYVVVGPFTACGPGLQVNKIGVDIICPSGLYVSDTSGNMSTRSVAWLVEARPVTNGGAAAGSWILLGSESLSAASTDPIRRSYTYSVDAGRYEVRITRTSEQADDDDTYTQDTCQWYGLRGYLTGTASLDTRATFLAVKMRASKQLSGLSERKISVIVKRKLKTWGPTNGWSSTTEETDSIAWALADILSNSDYGGGLSDNRIDLQTLYELDQLWTKRGDTFSYVYDKRMTIWEALSLCAQCGRARPIMRGSIFTFVRDSAQTLPVALFNERNIKKGSLEIDYGMVTPDSTDGVEVEFFNENTWASDYATELTPGATGEDGEPAYPTSVQYLGISTLEQATREALYLAACDAYRRITAKFETELEGFLPAYGDLIALSHSLIGWGASGDLTSYSDGVATTSEALTWSTGSYYVLLTDIYGDVHGPYRVSQGEDDHSIIFEDTPDFTPYTGVEQDRCRYAFGAADNIYTLCRVTGISPTSDDTVEITALVEDARVHTADNAYLGSSSSTGSGRTCYFAPDDTPDYDSATDSEHSSYGFFSDEDITVGSNDDEGYIYSE